MLGLGSTFLKRFFLFTFSSGIYLKLCLTIALTIVCLGGVEKKMDEFLLLLRCDCGGDVESKHTIANTCVDWLFSRVVAPSHTIEMTNR